MSFALLRCETGILNIVVDHRVAQRAARPDIKLIYHRRALACDLLSPSVHSIDAQMRHIDQLAIFSVYLLCCSQ